MKAINFIVNTALICVVLLMLLSGNVAVTWIGLVIALIMYASKRVFPYWWEMYTSTGEKLIKGLGVDC